MITREYKINLPKDVERILNVLHQYSNNSFLVGGCIRDILLGLEPKDWDFSTDIEYIKLLEIFKDYSPKEIGAHFGIIQIKVNDVYYEIAKLRKDIGISKDRTEQEVEFTSSLEEDLIRRDFTINAIAYDGNNLLALNEKQLWNIDDGVLVFMGCAHKRINEDPLRIFRMIRFACTKGLDIDLNIEFKSKSYVAWLNKENVIERLSMERIRDEFVKILMSNDPYKGLRLLSKFDLLKHIIPNANDLNLNQCNPYHNKPIIRHLFTTVEACEPILELRLSALLHDIGKPQCFTLDKDGVGHFYQHEKVGADMSRDILTNLKFENKVIDKVYVLVCNHMNKSHRQTPKAMRKLINKVGMDNMGLLFKLMEADIISSSPPYNFESLDNMKILFHEICKENEESPCLKITDIAINGHDLIKLGYVGKEIGLKLKELHELVLEHGNKINNYNELVKYC